MTKYIALPFLKNMIGICMLHYCSFGKLTHTLLTGKTFTLVLLDFNLYSSKTGRMYQRGGFSWLKN